MSSSDNPLISINCNEATLSKKSHAKVSSRHWMSVGAKVRGAAIFSTEQGFRKLHNAPSFCIQ